MRAEQPLPGPSARRDHRGVWTRRGLAECGGGARRWAVWCAGGRSTVRCAWGWCAWRRRCWGGCRRDTAGPRAWHWSGLRCRLLRRAPDKARERQYCSTTDRDKRKFRHETRRREKETRHPRGRSPTLRRSVRERWTRHRINDSPARNDPGWGHRALRINRLDLRGDGECGASNPSLSQIRSRSPRFLRSTEQARFALPVPERPRAAWLPMPH
jgi:hypothetical protein